MPTGHDGESPHSRQGKDMTYFMPEKHLSGNCKTSRLEWKLGDHIAGHQRIPGKKIWRYERGGVVVEMEKSGWMWSWNWHDLLMD